jgi:hypothetical protein
MSNTANTLTRWLALPILSAGIVAGAALGMAGTANAAPSISPNSSGNFHSPKTKATPAPTAQPGARWHREHNRFSLGIGE